MSIVTYAAYSKKNEIRENSSSGGIFSELALYVLSLGGGVSGVAFDKSFKSASHIIIEERNELNRITTSKYLQSQFSIHKEIKAKLDSGMMVLCSGTPCQIAGLKRFLGIEYENLILVDLICHGTPKQIVWGKYLEWQEKRYSGKVVDVNFRCKKKGWKKFSLSLTFDSKKTYRKVFDKDLYMKLYLSDFGLNRNCYRCPFKGDNRFSDITLGDFWGIDYILPELNDDKGISLVTINTEKGLRLFKCIEKNLVYNEVDRDAAHSYNLCAIQSAFEPERYDGYLEDVGFMSFDKLAKKYLPKPSIKQRLKKYRIIRCAISIRNRIMNGIRKK